jgi:ABC-type antimicrobial peptide transport system permease subunit
VTVDYTYFSGVEFVGPVEPQSVPEDVATKAAPRAIIVTTDGSAPSLERARTALSTSGFPGMLTASTRAENSGGSDQWAKGYAALANTGILIAALISAVSLAVSAIAGVIDRRRVLGLAWLTGMPGSVLKRMLAAEAALPIAAVAVLSIGLGFLVAWGVVAGLTQGRRSITWPEPGYLITLGVCACFTALAVVSTFGTARRSASMAATRFE